MGCSKEGTLQRVHTNIVHYFVFCCVNSYLRIFSPLIFLESGRQEGRERERGRDRGREDGRGGEGKRREGKRREGKGREGKEIGSTWVKPE